MQIQMSGAPLRQLNSDVLMFIVFSVQESLHANASLLHQQLLGL